MDPTVSSISPSTGTSATIGTLVTINGSNFVSTDVYTVLFSYKYENNPTYINMNESYVISIPTTYISDTELGFVVPELPSQYTYPSTTCSLIIINGNNTLISSNLIYTYTDNPYVPIIAGLSPSYGPVSGGNNIILSCGNIASNIKNDYVISFGTENVHPINISKGSISGETDLTCKVPPSTNSNNKTVSVTINNYDTNIYYTYYGTPTVTSMFPVEGYYASNDNVVTITGTNFSQYISYNVSFGGATPVRAFFQSYTQLICSVPPSTTASQVNVTVSVENTNTPIHSTSPLSYNYTNNNNNNNATIVNLPNSLQTMLSEGYFYLVTCDATYAWFTYSDANQYTTLVQMNISDNSVTSYPLSDTYYITSIFSNGTTLYLTGSSVSAENDTKLYEISCSNPSTIMNTYSLYNPAYFVSNITYTVNNNNTSAWFIPTPAPTSQSNNYVIYNDINTTTTTNVILTPDPNTNYDVYPLGITSDQNYVWVLNSYTNGYLSNPSTTTFTISQFSINDQSLLNTFTFNKDETLYPSCISSDGINVWVLNTSLTNSQKPLGSPSSLTKINCSNYLTQETISLGSYIINNTGNSYSSTIFSDGTYVWVSGSQESSQQYDLYGVLFQFDISRNSVVGINSVCNAPMLWASNGNYAWILNQMGNNISQVQLLSSETSPPPPPPSLPPVITSLSPVSGPMRGGNIVTINGKNFIKGSKYTVKIGNVPARNVFVHSAKKITCKAPERKKPGKVNVSISINGKKSNSKPYTYFNMQKWLNALLISHIVNKLQLRR